MTVETLILGGINYLDTRTEFWQQQKPIYARVRDRKLMQQRWLPERKRKPSEVARYILKSMEEIDMCRYPRWKQQERYDWCILFRVGNYRPDEQTIAFEGSLFPNNSRRF